MTKAKILFLCTGNSCRSQMAEGWANALWPDRLTAYSAGIETHGLNPRAVRVMAEAGVDIGEQRSQNVDELLDLAPDLVVTVCDHAAEKCPTLPGAKRTLHRSFPDPAGAEGTEDEILAEFRRVRDDIAAFVRTLPDVLAGESEPIQPWVPEEEEVRDYEIFRVRRYRARSPRTGELRPFTVVETRSWVNVVAITADRDVVLVRQYRHGTARVSLEIPGGVIDPGEDPADAAVRELREETGFAGERPEFLGVVEPNPAMLNNEQHTYLIRNAKPVGPAELDPGEDIEVVLRPLAEIPELIGSGGIRHSLVICAFEWLRRRDPAAF